MELAGLVAYCALLAVAAATDVRCRRIPNLIPLALVTLLPVERIAVGQVSTLPAALAVGAAGLVFGFALFSARVWGGGDAKLAAAVAAWVGVDGLMRFLLAMSLAGGLLAVGMLLVNRFRPYREGDEPLPYGVAIAIGGVDWALSRIT